MKVEVVIHKAVEIDVEPSDIINEVNELPIIERWNYVAKLINSINVDDAEKLEKHQSEIIRKFLERKLQLFNPKP